MISRAPIALPAPEKSLRSEELRDKEHFVLGLQWHPEIGWETDDLSQKIFRCLVEAAKKPLRGGDRPHIVSG
jgi:hypothetical protein